MERWLGVWALGTLSLVCAGATAACALPGASTATAGAGAGGPSSILAPSASVSRRVETTDAASTGDGRATNAPVAPATSHPLLTPVAAVAPPASVALRGKVIVIDPGHNGDNYRHTAQINRKVNIGNGTKACNTTGTETDAGYSEAAFNFDVATRLASVLRAQGATVVLTRTDNRGVGPCINERAAIGNRVHANAVISIHGDGAPAAGYGFHVIVPRGIGPNDAIVAPSRHLGMLVRDAFLRGAGEPRSTYTGTTTGGLVARSDLGGLNLSAVPVVLIECGNMRNPADARRMINSVWRGKAAAALATGLNQFLTGVR
jgi:N-acetylmuramoyl-L-alanine amidase